MGRDRAGSEPAGAGRARRCAPPTRPRSDSERRTRREPRAGNTVAARVRADKLFGTPFCEVCTRRGKLAPAHQVVPVTAGGPALPELSELESRCDRCADRAHRSGGSNGQRCGATKKILYAASSPAPTSRTAPNWCGSGVQQHDVGRGGLTQAGVCVSAGAIRPRSVIPSHPRQPRRVPTHDRQNVQNCSRRGDGTAKLLTI